jgi:acetyl esterase/lipase
MTNAIHDLTPNLDPELAEKLKAMPEWSLTPESLPFIREFSAVQAAPAPQEFVVDNCEVPSSKGQHKISVRIYRPLSLTVSFNVLVWMHGGGFVMGSVSQDDSLCLDMAKAGQCVVVSVDYRLAPEHPFPAAPDDCYDVLEWVASQPEVLGIQEDKVAVGGVSAGGCLAAAMAIMARDKNGPSLHHQLLVIPVTDDRLDTPSSQRIQDLRVWDRQAAIESWCMYLGTTDREATSPYAAPNRAKDLTGLPPATVLVEDCDVLRDEAVDYANRLNDAGVNTELHVYPRTFHGHFSFAPDAEISKRTYQDILASVQRAFSC